MSANGAAVAAFMECRRIALAGASRGGRGFGDTLLKELLARGRQVTPVHPHATWIGGLPCVPSLAALPHPVEALVVCLPPRHVPRLIQEAAACGIGRVWLQQGASSPEALDLAEQLGLTVVAGSCLLMHLEPVTGVHALHRRIHHWLVDVTRGGRRWG